MQDFQQLAKQIHYKPVFTNAEFKRLDKVINQDETVFYLMEGLIGDVHGRPINGRGLAILTNKRVLFFRHSLIGTETKEEFKISNISAASLRKGLAYGSMIISVANNDATIEQCSKKAVEEFVTKLRELMHKPTQPTVVNATTSLADELKKLADLKSAGILTDEEFQIQKQKLLL
jgi:hypothetical protein